MAAEGLHQLPVMQPLSFPSHHLLPESAPCRGNRPPSKRGWIHPHAPCRIRPSLVANAASTRAASGGTFGTSRRRSTMCFGRATGDRLDPDEISSAGLFRRKELQDCCKRTPPSPHDVSCNRKHKSLGARGAVCHEGTMHLGSTALAAPATVVPGEVDGLHESAVVGGFFSCTTGPRFYDSPTSYCPEPTPMLVTQSISTGVRPMAAGREPGLFVSVGCGKSKSYCSWLAPRS